MCSLRARRLFLDVSPPVAFAHRGGAAEAPENTMAAFEAAVAMGYRYLETDAQLTRDGTVVAFHDDTLDRVTNMRGPVADRTIDELATADAGYRFTRDGGRTYPFRARGCSIPRVEDILTRWPHVLVNIDLKSEATVAPLAALIRRLGVEARMCVASFSARRLARFRRLSGGKVCTSMARPSVAAARLATLARLPAPALGADCVQVPVRWGRVRIVDTAFVAGVHRSGLAVHVWTIDDEMSMRALLELGVDGIMTDRPSLLRDVLASRGQWEQGARASA